MKVGELSISWRYDGPKITIPIIKNGRVVGGKPGIDPVETRCTIMNGDKVIAVGEAHRHPNDGPNKIKGRIISLTRALKHLYPTAGPSKDKEQRRLVWMAYADLAPAKRANWDRHVYTKFKEL